MHAYICVCLCVWESWRQKGAQEVLTVEIKEELERAEQREAHSNTRERERDSLNIQISHFNSAADYWIFHLWRKDRP